jgi:hypothetical protein
VFGYSRHINGKFSVARIGERAAPFYRPIGTGFIIILATMIDRVT